MASFSRLAEVMFCREPQNKLNKGTTHTVYLTLGHYLIHTENMSDLIKSRKTVYTVRSHKICSTVEHTNRLMFYKRKSREFALFSNKAKFHGAYILK